MSTPNDTLRAHLEAIRDRHRTVINGIGVECGCAEGCAGAFPCADNLDAVAALRILNEADIDDLGPEVGRIRIVCDPDPSGDDTVDRSYPGMAWPDPGGRAAPPPTTPP